MKFSHLCGSSAQHGACVEGTHHGSPLFSPQGPSAKGPEEICISGRGGEKAAGSNFCKCVGRGDAVRWPRKGWRAATRSSSGQTVQEEKWLRKSFLGSLRERLRRAKPSRDVRPQPYVQTLSKSTPNPPPPGLARLIQAATPGSSSPETQQKTGMSVGSPNLGLLRVPSFPTPVSPGCRPKQR